MPAAGWPTSTRCVSTKRFYEKIGIDYGIGDQHDGYDEISLTGDFKVTTNKYEKLFKYHPTSKLNTAGCQGPGGRQNQREVAAKMFDDVAQQHLQD